jgi:hypothetical protein
MRYIIIDNLMNENLRFRAILTKMTFVTSSVASLILDYTYFVFGLPFSTTTLTHVSLKCHFESFVALLRGFETLYRNGTL